MQRQQELQLDNDQEESSPGVQIQRWQCHCGCPCEVALHADGAIAGANRLGGRVWCKQQTERLRCDLRRAEATRHAAMKANPCTDVL